MKTINLLALAAAAASTTLASSAHAHIDVFLGDATGRNGNQKAIPCDGTRGDGPVFTYAPGATIDIKVDENVPHPGYFRIAFDGDGEDFMSPRSIDPVDKSRECPFQGDPKDQCGEPDFCNNETVLYDNLEPHTFYFPGKSYTWTIKLPDIECDNCTLQVIQVMEDTIHGAYCPGDVCQDSSLEDVYNRCFDIKLEKGAKGGPGLSTKAVTLPADKKYKQCEWSAGEPSEEVDAGKDAGRTGNDAGEEPGEPTDDAEPGSTADAGAKVDAGSKKDAGVKKDSGTKAEEVDEDDEPAAASMDDGCALASSRGGVAWSALALMILLARRRRRG